MSIESSPTINTDANNQQLLEACKQMFGDRGVPIRLIKNNRFFRVKETLQRIGNVQSSRSLNQLVYILHRQGSYALMHYKELQAIDVERNGETNTSCEMEAKDYAKRNTIASMLASWGMIEILDPECCKAKAPASSIKVLSRGEAAFWECKSSYLIGRYKVRRFQRNANHAKVA